MADRDRLASRGGAAGWHGGAGRIAGAIFAEPAGETPWGGARVGELVALFDAPAVVDCGGRPRLSGDEEERACHQWIESGGRPEGLGMA